MLVNNLKMPPSIEVEIYLRANEHRDAALAASLESVYHFMTNKVECNKTLSGIELHQSVEYIRVCCPRLAPQSNNHIDCITTSTPEKTACYPVQLAEGSSTEVFDNEDGDSTSTSSICWNLPNRDFDGTWETLFFQENIKMRLLTYALTSLQLAKKGLNPDIVCCNRLILLHGPPGTGKTTLCKALAQKLSIRMYKDYPSALFVEVNCHSLFSKWFSESGKLVAKMFSSIREYASDPEILVVILIDEVESLTAARQASINSGEPSDAIRVVNAVLTQLDLLRFHTNVFVFATSNLTEVIDPAFADRADMIQYIGPPGPQEISLILNSCFEELERIGILPVSSIFDNSELANDCNGLSGRAVRKLPLMALSEWNENTFMSDDNVALSTEVFSDLVKKAAKRLQESKNQLK